MRFAPSDFRVPVASSPPCKHPFELIIDHTLVVCQPHPATHVEPLFPFLFTRRSSDPPGPFFPLHSTISSCFPPIPNFPSSNSPSTAHFRRKLLPDARFPIGGFSFATVQFRPLSGSLFLSVRSRSFQTSEAPECSSPRRPQPDIFLSRYLDPPTPASFLPFSLVSGLFNVIARILVPFPLSSSPRSYIALLPFCDRRSSGSSFHPPFRLPVATSTLSVFYSCPFDRPLLVLPRCP